MRFLWGSVLSGFALLGVVIGVDAGEQPACSITPTKSQAAVDQWLARCADPLTAPEYTVLRGGAGLFHAPRVSGTLHQGVDVVLRLEKSGQCLPTTNDFSGQDLSVRAIADGTIAYSRLNAGVCPDSRPDCDPLATTGLGLTVIVDHGNGLYSLYAHLAQDRNQVQCFPDSVVLLGDTMPYQVGEQVEQGDIVGYLGQLGPNVDKYDSPTGNATATAEPAQVHFEIFQTAPGKRSIGAISDIVTPSARGLLDPTVFLRRSLSTR